MAKLLIVESPSKAKTIGNYLGKEYHVLASYGHIRNLLPKSQGVDTNDFAMKYADAMRRIAPRTEPLETKIEDPKKETTDTHWGSYTRTTITKLDTESNVG